MNIWDILSNIFVVGWAIVMLLGAYWSIQVIRYPNKIETFKKEG